MALLTKSKYMTGLQCPKYLWVTFNDPTRIPPFDPARQFIFEQGHEVGGIAKKLFPGGVDVPTDDFKLNIQQTKSTLKERRPIFEAGFLSDDLFARVDILRPQGSNGWEIIEVKSSTTVKDEHVPDVAFQKHVCEKAGLEITGCSLMRIDNQYVRQGEVNPSEFLTQEDISGPVDVEIADVSDNVKEMFKVIKEPKEPSVSIGPQCGQPYECPLKEICWAFLPKRSVFELYRGGQAAFDLLSQGILAMADIPSTFSFTPAQRIQKDAVTTNAAQIDKPALQSFLAQLKWPLYFMDFETINPAVPLFDGTRPYQKIPFQFSLHIILKGLESPQHYSFLADGPQDPRPAFLKELKGLIGDTGTVIVYNQTFEENILKDLADCFTKEAGWIKNVISRMVDLLIPFRSFHYYHPDQKGSASIKKVLPALTGKGYEGMAISEGEEASQEFYRVTYHDVPAAERAPVRQHLEEYCKLDTQAMIDIMIKLHKLIE
jgi:hypothetical protein